MTLRFAMSSWVALLGASLALGACSSSSDSSGAPSPDGGVNPDASGTTEDSSTPSPDGGQDPATLVPPVRKTAEVATACPAAYQTAPGAGQHGDYPIDEQQRSFYLQLPDSSKFTGPRPLLVVFNGTNMTGKGAFEEWKLQAFLDAGFVVLAPDSIGNGTVWPVWDALRQANEQALPNKDLDYFDSIVECISAHYEVDAKRIYVAGHSAGGMMSSAVLQRRSSLLAGGIVASGMLDLTSPIPAQPIDTMGVIVTWGGDNDQWSGQAGSGVAVPQVNFVEQASLSSKFWEAQAQCDQVWGKGKNLGHKWLEQANPWMINYLLWHPKGLAKNSPWTYAPADASLNFTTGQDAVQYTSTTEVTCEASPTDGCHEFCQFIGDCAVENATIAPVLGPQLDSLGFSGDSHTNCGGCLTKCQQGAAAGGAQDAEVLQCYKTAQQSAACGSGLSGAMPFITATNSCCASKLQSVICTSLCTSILTNTAAASLFGACKAWAPDAGQ